MLLVYGESQKNPRRAVQLYAQRYPERVIPSLKIFARLERNLRANNEAFSSRKGRKIVKRVNSDNTVATVLQYFEDHPRNSIRQACRELNLKYSSVRKILKENGYHDYKLHNLEHLSDQHQQRRINYVAQVMENLEINDNRFFQHVLWTDESRFVSNGKPNKKNEHFWATENPHFVNPIENQGHFGINVWCGIINGHLIGPYFYEGVLHSERYLQFLQEQLPVLLENVPLQLRANMCFQHDGAPPHKARIVQQYLNETYGENWIGINGPIQWAPKSPDLTPLDFFLWGTLKNKIYRTPSVNLEHLKEKIRNACDELSREMLRKASVREVRRRLDKCLEVGGGYIENLL